MFVHRLIPSLLVLLLLAPAVHAQSASEWSPELAMQVKRVAGVIPSPDGRLVVYQVSPLNKY